MMTKKSMGNAIVIKADMVYPKYAPIMYIAKIPPLILNTINEPNAPLVVNDAISTQYIDPIRKGPAPENPATILAITIPVAVRHVSIKIQLSYNLKLFNFKGNFVYFFNIFLPHMV